MRSRGAGRGPAVAVGGFVVAIVALVACRSFYVLPEAPDAAADALGSPDATSPCRVPTANRLFCDDFDEGALGATWDRGALPHGSLDPTSVSPPRSLRIQFQDPPDPVVETLEKDLDVSSTANIHIEFDLRIDTVAPVYPVALYCGPDGYAIVLNLDGYVNEQAGPTPYGGYKFGTFPVGTWKHVRLGIRRGDGSVDMQIDGVTVIVSTKVAKPAMLAAGACSLVVGMYYAEKHLSWDGRLDNVLVTTF